MVDGGGGARVGTDAQDAWVLRVLGLRLSMRGQTGNGYGAAIGDRVRQMWQLASDTADEQIAALQAALHNTDDEVLHEIAEYGVNAVTGGNKTQMMVAMRMLGSGDAAALRKARPMALAAIAAFRAHLDGDERVLACDENPFGVKVTLRTTLGGALAEMAARLEGALGARA